MAGIATEVCVESTARDVFFLDYSVVMAEDCMTGFSTERHQAALTLFNRSFGVVASSSVIMAAWSKAATVVRGWQRETKRKTVLATLAERARPVHTALVVIGLQEPACAAKDAKAARQARDRRHSSYGPRSPRQRPQGGRDDHPCPLRLW